MRRSVVLIVVIHEHFSLTTPPNFLEVLSIVYRLQLFYECSRFLDPYYCHILLYMVVGVPYCTFSTGRQCRYRRFDWEEVRITLRKGRKEGDLDRVRVGPEKVCLVLSCDTYLWPVFVFSTR